MLNIDTLFKNKDIFNPNSVDQENNYGIWDLTRSSMTFKNINLEFQRYMVVSEEFQMRPDQLAFQAYSSEDYSGSLMKINGISNPFALQEGDMVVAPTKASIDASFNSKEASIKANEGGTNPNQKFRDSQEQKRFKVSDSRQKFLEQRNRAKNAPSQVLPPNVMQEGERQTVRTNSVIGLAPDVSNRNS
jgi:hypothetical protein